MPFAPVNGQNLYYEDTGGALPVVVFSHGLLMDRRMFAPQVAALRGQYRCICWDERGHGNTGDATQPFSYYDSADDLAALLHFLGVNSAVLAGMSQGGYLSLRAALKHPALVRALILIDTQARPESPANLPLYTQLISTWTSQGMDDELAATIEHIILGNGYADAATWKRHWKAQSAANLQQIFNTLASRDDISAAIHAIRVPTLVVHGDADNAIPLESAQEMAGAIAGSGFVTIAGAGHAANLTHADAVNPQLLSFLKVVCAA